LAQTAQIQGNVILHIAIDANGNVSQLRVVSGHPMLAPAALSAVRNWKYSPFTSNGQPVSVFTVAVVRFGNPANHDADDRAEVAFQDKFWEAMDQAQGELNANNLTAAGKTLAQAQIPLLAGGPPPRHLQEHWQWEMLMGQLNRQQHNFTDSEQRYKQAVSLQKDNRQGPAAAASLAALGELYFESDKPAAARDNLNQAIAVYKKNYKAADKNSSAQALYARGIVDAAWLLSKMALSDHTQDEALKQCKIVSEYQTSLTAADPKVEDCRRILSHPESSTP